MTNPQPFRFRDLPKDIRFMVYDLLPLITRHHVVKVCGRGGGPFGLGGHPERSVIIVSKRLPGICLMCTCREIYAEAHALHKKMAEAKSLRIIADWRSVGGTAMKAMILCASPSKCGNSEELKTLLHPVGSCPSDRGQVRIMCNAAHISHHDYNTHDEIHALLRHGTASKSPLRIEIAVQCGDDLVGKEDQLEEYCWLFYRWIALMSGTELEGQVVDIVLRPMPDCGVADHVLLSRKPFTDVLLSDANFLSGSWGCSVGGQVRLAEWKETWEEGVKY